MNYSQRPVDMLHRQLLANRMAAHYRNPETGKRHYCHVEVFRAAFIRDMRGLRDELKRRGLYPRKKS